MDVAGVYVPPEIVQRILSYVPTGYIPLMLCSKQLYGLLWDEDFYRQTCNPVEPHRECIVYTRQSVRNLANHHKKLDQRVMVISYYTSAFIGISFSNADTGIGSSYTACPTLELLTCIYYNDFVR